MQHASIRLHRLSVNTCHTALTTCNRPLPPTTPSIMELATRNNTKIVPYTSLTHVLSEKQNLIHPSHITNSHLLNSTSIHLLTRKQPLNTLSWSPPLPASPPLPSLPPSSSSPTSLSAPSLSPSVTTASTGSCDVRSDGRVHVVY